MAGTRLQDLHPDIGKVNDPENWEQVHKDVINRYAWLCILQLELAAFSVYCLIHVNKCKKGVYKNS